MKLTNPCKPLSIKETNTFLAVKDTSKSIAPLDMGASKALQIFNEKTHMFLEGGTRKQINETLGIPVDYNINIVSKEKLFDLFIKRIEDYQNCIGVLEKEGKEYIKDNFPFIRLFMDMGLADIPMDIKKIEKLISIAPESTFGTIMCFNVAESGRNGVLCISMGIDESILANIKTSEECINYVIKNYKAYSHCEKMQSVIRYALLQIHKNRDWYWKPEKNPEFNILSAIGSLNDDEMKDILKNICYNIENINEKSIEDQIFEHQTEVIIQRNQKKAEDNNIFHNFYEDNLPKTSSNIDSMLFENIHSIYKNKCYKGLLTTQDKDKIFELLIESLKTIFHLNENYKQQKNKDEKELQNIKNCIDAVRHVLQHYQIHITWDNIKSIKEKLTLKEFHNYILKILIQDISGDNLQVPYRLGIGIEYKIKEKKNLCELMQVFSRNWIINVEDKSDEELIIICLKWIYEKQIRSFGLLRNCPFISNKEGNNNTINKKELPPAHLENPLEFFICIGFLLEDTIKELPGLGINIYIGEEELGQAFIKLLKSTCKAKIKWNTDTFQKTFLAKKSFLDNAYLQYMNDSIFYLLEFGILPKDFFTEISEQYSQVVMNDIQEKNIYLSPADIQQYKEIVIRKELGKKNIALTNHKDYFPKESESITISKKELFNTIEQQIFTTGKLFNPDHKNEFIEAIIGKKQVIKEFASHHALHLYQTIFQGNIQLSPNDVNQYKEKLIKNALGYKGLLVGKKTNLLENKIIDAKQYLPHSSESATITQEMIIEHTKKQVQEKGVLFNPIDKDDLMKVFVKRTEKIHQKIEKDIEKILEKTRNKYIGLFPVGGKIHFQKAVSEEAIEKFKKSYGFESTPFQMIHANTSMLLPPCPSPDEVAHMIECLQKDGLINHGRPDLQVCIAGRVSTPHAAVLGSAMIFCASYIKNFSVGDFSTSHDEATGARIMAYDAGVLSTDFKYMPKNITGRTDMLARQDVKDIFLYQFIGSLVSQSIHGGMFQKEGKMFIQEYKNILKSYGNEFILNGNWIYDQDREKGSDFGAEKHHQLLEKCNDILRKDTQKGVGMVHDIKNLLLKYHQKIQRKQNEILVMKNIKQQSSKISQKVMQQIS